LPCCAPGRATNPWIRCIAWVIFPIFALTRATNPAIRCITWLIFRIFAQTRATNPAIRCIAWAIFPIFALTRATNPAFVASHGSFSRFLPKPVQRIRGFVARVAHTPLFCRILLHPARRIREFVARRMPFSGFLPFSARRIAGHGKRPSCDTNRVCHPGLGRGNIQYAVGESGGGARRHRSRREMAGETPAFPGERHFRRLLETFGRARRRGRETFAERVHCPAGLWHVENVPPQLHPGRPRVFPGRSRVVISWSAGRESASAHPA
jgi:hypothetical protein